jgi:hypothetical protein
MSRTDFLFSTPSFIGGMASVLDLGTTLVVYNESPSPVEADFKAIQSDWGVTGIDLMAAMNEWQNTGHAQE